MSDMPNDDGNEEDETDETEEEGEGEDEGDGDDSETIVRAWETAGALSIELHDCDDHCEVLATECDDDNAENTVTLAFNVEELDEAIKILGEVRAEMVKQKLA